MSPGQALKTFNLPEGFRIEVVAHEPMITSPVAMDTTGEGQATWPPVAYTHITDESRVFYTSLGYPDDFKEPRYRNLLVNVIRRALN